MRSREQLVEKYRSGYADSNPSLPELTFDQAVEYLKREIMGDVAYNRRQIEFIDQKIEELQKNRIGHARDLEIDEETLKEITG